MSQAIVEARQLGKRYRLGEHVRHDLVSERIARVFSNRFARRRQRSTPEDFWALRDVSFEVREGEVLGVIGRNGAGKSTLLKILSRITEPTTGEARIRGRVASLLEVGTGFHKELTGRENVFLNGAILGMTSAEIRSRFDDIVAFAGVEPFIDTPVKRYSSGMTVRLAFAVAAHLEPEVLIIDEVLAVGDLGFQQRCIGKMSEVASSGRTVLFVSHNMAAVSALCDRVLLLADGQVAGIGETRSLVERYAALAGGGHDARQDLANHPGRPGSAVPLMDSLALLDQAGNDCLQYRTGDTLRIRVAFGGAVTPINPVLGYVVRDSLGTPLFSLDNRIVPGYRFDAVHEGVIVAELPSLPLAPGRYGIDLFLGDATQSIDRISGAATFEIVESDVYGSGRMPPSQLGAFIQHGSWSMEAEPDAHSLAPRHGVQG